MKISQLNFEKNVGGNRVEQTHFCLYLPYKAAHSEETFIEVND